MARQRESWIDITKGIAIIFVVMGHVVTSYRNSGLLQDAAIFNFICDFLYVFHMPLFFVISGYLDGKSQREEPLRLVLLRKCIVLGIPYLVFSVVAVGLNLLAHNVTNTTRNLWDLLLIPVFPISSLWFLYALLIISVVQNLVNRIDQNSKNRIILLLAAFAVKIAAHLIGGLRTVKASGFSECVLFDVGKYWFWYLLGEDMIHVLTADRKQLLSKIPYWLCAGITLLYVGIVYALRDTSADNMLLDMVMAMIGVVMSCVWGIKISRCELLEYLGKYTLPIYLLHTYIISFIRVVLSKLHVPLLSGLVPMLICSLLGILLPLLVYEITTRVGGFDFVFYPGRYLLQTKLREKNIAN